MADTADIARIPGSHDLIVRQMTWEAQDVLSLSLCRPSREQLPSWEAGAHIDLVLRRDLIRQYSLCGDPADRTQWRVAVLREDPGTGGSRYIHDLLRPGARVAVAGPRNNFALVEARSYLFIAGGIGVTPFLPMIADADRRGADWHLLYGGRHRSSMAFLSELAGYGEHVTFCPEDEFGLLDLAGFLGRAESHSVVYCCGPEPLIAAVEKECADRGRPEPFVERFKARPGASTTTADPERDAAFQVILADSRMRLRVGPGQTIVEALDEARVFAPTSCREGYCGLCETTVLAGVPDHRDDYLTPEARESNTTMMICVSRSQTPELEIKL